MSDRVTDTEVIHTMRAYGGDDHDYPEVSHGPR
jgi:hypothetical protein